MEVQTSFMNQTLILEVVKGTMTYVVFELVVVDIGCANGGGGFNSNPTNPTNPITPQNPNNPSFPVLGGGSGTQVSTTPIVLYPLMIFVNKLSTEHRSWWDNVSNSLMKGKITKFLSQNRSLEAEQYAEDIITYLNDNNNSPEAIEEIENILDLLDDGKIDGQDVVLAPDEPIINMTQYLSVFDTSQPAEITIYADQPLKGSNFPVGPDRVGHAFISIKQGTKIRSLGFYPKNTLLALIPNLATPDPRDFLPTLGQFGNDQGHSFDASISKQITAVKLLNTLNEIITVFQSNPFYNLNNSNCVDSAINIFENSTDIDLPNCEIPILWKGQTPAVLGEVIKTFILPTNVTRNTTGGIAPLNNNN